MTVPTLHDVLIRATDEIESPDLALGALAEADRRRAHHRRGIAAAFGTAVAVGSLVAVMALVDSDESSEPAPGLPTPPTTPRDASRLWDPRDVDELPAAADDVATVLPADIEPPSRATLLMDAPISAAVLAVSDGLTVAVLSVDGEWRGIPVPEKYAQASLSRRGTRLVFQTQTALQVWDLPTGEQAAIPFPEDLAPWDFQRTKWIDETTLLLDDYTGGWVVDVNTRTSRRVPYPTDFAWAVDNEGVVVESASYDEPNLFTDWAAGTPRRLPMKVTGRLERLVATTDTIIGTSYDKGPFRVMVADRSDLTVQAVLPLRDHDANYSNWALLPVAELDGGVVLLWVAVVGPDDGWRLVAWDPGSDDLSVVSRSDAVPTDSVTYAVDLLR